MNQTFVANSGFQSATQEAVCEALSLHYERLAPQLQRAATHILEQPDAVGLSSVRELARAAGVKPNTLVRLAQALGFEGYEAFRRPFRDALREAQSAIPQRARWLQDQGQAGSLDGVYAEMARGSLANLELSFAATDAGKLRAAARELVGAGRVYVLGVGINQALVHSFAYLLSMARDNVYAIPRLGNAATDDLAQAGESDLLLAITFKPYRAEVMEAFAQAHAQGLRLIGVSDSPASPLLRHAHHAFLTHTETAQFFTSISATAALLETLVAFIIGESGPDVIGRIDALHARRHALGIYVEERSPL